MLENSDSQGDHLRFLERMRTAFSSRPNQRRKSVSLSWFCDLNSPRIARRNVLVPRTLVGNRRIFALASNVIREQCHHLYFVACGTRSRRSANGNIPRTSACPL